MVLTLRNRRRNPLWLPFLALIVLLAFGGAGCAPGTPLGPQVQVADTPEKAFANGEAKLADAKKALDADRRDDAARMYGETATYYKAVAGKFNSPDNALQAYIDQADALVQQVDASTPKGKTANYTSAQVALRNALKQYPPSLFTPGTHGAQVRQDAEQAYDSLVLKMDQVNSESIYYKIMDFLVHALGNNSAVAPILAILLIAIMVNVATWPLILKQIKSAKEFSRYQPELKKLQEKYKGDPQELFARQQAFMKEHGINQFAGCLPALATWPITLLMYYVIVYYQFHFRATHFLWVNPAAGNLSYTWPSPLTGIIGHNLSEQDMPLLILYALSMFVQAKTTPISPSADPAQIEQQKMMATFMPLIMFVTLMSWQPPAAFVLYWIFSIVFSAARYWWINRSLPDMPPLVLNADGSPVGGNSASSPLTANPKLISPKNRQVKRK